MSKPVQTVDSYINARSATVRETLNRLRAFVRATLPEVTEGMKYGAPVFFTPGGKPVIYLYGGKDHANLGFLHGAELDDPEQVLKGSGVSGRHIKFFPDDPIPVETVEELLRQCIELDHIGENKN